MAGGIKGPSSALSSFLREKGIHVPRYNAYGRAVPEAAALIDPLQPIEPTNDQPDPNTSEETVPEPDRVLIEISSLPQKQPSKKKQKKSAENEQEKEKDLKRPFEDESDSELKLIAPRAKHTKKSTNTQKLAKQIQLDMQNMDSSVLLLCVKCGRKIGNESEVNGSVNNIGNVKGKNDVCGACASIPKSKKKVTKVLLSERCEVKSLQTFCIELISVHIQAVEEFGDISENVKDGIMRILCRRRQLNETNIGLFLGPQERSLNISDCTLIGMHGFSLISSFSPNITTLSLSLYEAMEIFSKSLLKVKNLKLGGCFLVSDVGMKTYLAVIAQQLEELTLVEGQKLSIGAFEPLLKWKCLKKLVLKRCPNVCGEVLKGLSSLSELRVLKLIDVGGKELFDAIGEQLSVLSLSGLNIGDSVIESIGAHCTKLTELSLKSLTEITPEAITNLFKALSMIRIEKINLRRLVQTTDEAIKLILENSAPNLRKLNLNGLDELTNEFFESMVKFSFGALEVLDVSFVRSFCDVCLIEMLKCGNMKIIKVLTEMVLNGVWRNISGERIKLLGNEFD